MFTTMDGSASQIILIELNGVIGCGKSELFDHVAYLLQNRADYEDSSLDETSAIMVNSPAPRLINTFLRRIYSNADENYRNTPACATFIATYLFHHYNGLQWYLDDIKNNRNEQYIIICDTSISAVQNVWIPFFDGLGYLKESEKEFLQMLIEQYTRDLDLESIGVQVHNLFLDTHISQCWENIQEREEESENDLDQWFLQALDLYYVSWFKNIDNNCKMRGTQNECLEYIFNLLPGSGEEPPLKSYEMMSLM